MSISRFACSLCAALLALSLAACHRARPALDEGLAALSSAGLALEPFHPIAPGPLSAKECRAGKVEKLDAVLCAYGSADARAHGERACEGWIAQATTGALARRDVDKDRSSGEARWLLLAVADRGRVDLSGRAIQKIVRAFEKK